MKSRKQKPKAAPQPHEVIIDVAEEDYQAGRAKGLPEEMVLTPGRHRFVRGINPLVRAGFLPATPPSQLRLSILIDEDVLEHFKRRAAAPNALPYLTQINRALRSVMMRDRGLAVELEDEPHALINDPDFIRAVAAAVRAQAAQDKAPHEQAA